MYMRAVRVRAQAVPVLRCNHLYLVLSVYLLGLVEFYPTITVKGRLSNGATTSKKQKMNERSKGQLTLRERSQANKKSEERERKRKGRSAVHEVTAQSERRVSAARHRTAPLRRWSSAAGAAPRIPSRHPTRRAAAAVRHTAVARASTCGWCLSPGSVVHMKKKCKAKAPHPATRSAVTR